MIIEECSLYSFLKIICTLCNMVYCFLDVVPKWEVMILMNVEIINKDFPRITKNFKDHVMSHNLKV